MIEYQAIRKEGLSTQIANAIRKAILDGALSVEERLPSETELAGRFGVSRATVREAMKRLAAQNLIRSERGATGGAFVNRITWDEARADLVSTTRLLISMNNVPVEDAIEARFMLEAACLPLACANRNDADLKVLTTEIALQRSEDLTDEGFCDSDVRFHSAVARATGNPLLEFQVSGAVEAMQPLMNMLVYRLRDRKHIAELHVQMSDAVTAQHANAAHQVLNEIAAYTRQLAELRRAPKD
ncbi:MAG: GntR family transcriptional regulator [Roseibium sp.]